MKRTVLIAALAAVCVLHAQESSPVRVSEAFLLTGTDMTVQQTGTLQDFRSIAPISAILADDYAGYTGREGYLAASNTFFAAGLGLTFNDRPNPVLRVGIGLMRKTNLSLLSFREDSYIYDTLTSSQTGTMYAIDSIVHRRLRADEISDYFNLDASLIYSTNRDNRWSFYGGAGLTMGIGFNSVVSVSYSEYVENWTIEGYESSDMDVKEEERIRIGNRMALGAYLPLGIDFRIGKKREFWQHIHFIYELRPSLYFNGIDNFGTLITPGLSTSGGLRFDF